MWPRPVVASGAVRAGLSLQRLEVADDADVVERAVLAQREPGRVVAPVLEPLEALEQQVFTGSLADVSDDPAHAETSLKNAKGPAATPALRRVRSAELSCNESGDGTTGFFGFSSRFCLGQDANHGLRAGRPHQNTAFAVEGLVQVARPPP